jgi:cytochrome o ubiquinol oxidase subunit 1
LIGGLIIAVGVVLQLAQILASIIERKRLRDTTGDPWDARSLEWSVTSTPPSYNFTVIPHIKTRDAFWEIKQHTVAKPAYEDILIPKNTAAGIYISIFAFLLGFGFVWQITWLIIASIIGILVVFVRRGFDEHSEYTLTAAEVEKRETSRHKKLQVQAAATPEYADPDEDMSLRELISYLLAFGRNVIKNKRWRTW